MSRVTVKSIPTAMSDFDVKIVVRFIESELAAQIRFIEKRFGTSLNVNIVLNKGGEHDLCWTRLEGGIVKNTIDIGLDKYVRYIGTSREMKYDEYRHIKKKAGIGEAIVKAEMHLAYLISHEVAHALVNSYAHYNTYMKLDGFTQKEVQDLKPHGVFWQKVYGIQRAAAHNRNHFE